MHRYLPAALSTRPGRAIRLLAALAFAVLGPAAHAFGFADVDRRARDLAAKSYAKPSFSLPKPWRDLGYDQLRDIRYDPARALWRAQKLPFEVHFFHLGGIYDLPVRINEVVGRQVRQIAFNAAHFDYGKNAVEPSTAPAHYAGFRATYAVNQPGKKDEVVVFLGASYFRALGEGQRYGASARGLAIDTAERGGEEFPRFVEFWLERPQAAARELVVHALLDSRRATGAYRFVIRPGVETVTDVEARVYLREPVAKLAIAPLTSMYFYGENQRAPVDGFRPEVHDSDGLSIAMSNGEWIWRPLVNPRRLLVTSFALDSPRGFGLMQRDRSFARYEDLEARYELRPSLWVEPKSAWGRGRVELVQIPTADEFNDNIVAFWVPDATPAKGKPFQISYRIYWQKERERRPPSAWVAQSRRGQGGQPLPDDVLAFTVDFEGPALKKLAADASIEAELSVSGARREGLELHHNEVTGGWRMVVRVRRQGKDQPIELRAFLKDGEQVLSETWSYIVPQV
jgi:periplasmic glucans biosynthesis protein